MESMANSLPHSTDNVDADAPRPTRLQLGTSRLELLPEVALQRFLNKTWIHFGDAPDKPSVLRRCVRETRLRIRGIRAQELYAKTSFQPFYYQQGMRLPFDDGSMHFIFSEHFFEHLFFDEALDLMKECHRILAQRGVMRLSVPDADLRTYDKPEPAGYPDRRLPFDHPNKHKTRWSIYLLSEALRICGFDCVPLRYCDRYGRYHRNEPRLYDGCPERELIEDLSYLRRPDSLIVDAVKP